jgi:hypothetical protein
MRARFVAAAIVAMLAFAGLTAYAADRKFGQPATAAVKAEKRPGYCKHPSGQGVIRAGSVAAIFVLSTVLSDGERAAPECSYDYVTDALRLGDTREEWARGDIAVIPMIFDTIEPGYVQSYALPGTIRAVHRTKLGLSCNPDTTPDCLPKEVSALIVVEGIYRREIAAQQFLIRLVFRDGDWRVSYWSPLASGGAPGPSSAG